MVVENGVVRFIEFVGVPIASFEESAFVGCEYWLLWAVDESL